jgi:hypothetical protein
MAKNKTTENTNSVPSFLETITDDGKRKDCLLLTELFQKETGYESKMWGTAIIGFGSVHYKYESGREGDMPIVAFSPRKAAIVLYLSSDFEKRDELLQKLGKHKTGKGCIYINKLEDIKIDILKKMILNSVQRTIKNKN